jgi:serine/threonine protein kinase
MTPAPFEAPTLEALAALLPAYEFEAFIAQGGMGAVYKARQRSLDRDVAIKILPRELGEDPEFRQSFETEARAMARLNHPNLIGVYDSGDVDGMLYIAMEYVNGKSLYYSAYNLAVDPPQAALIVKGICEGLAHAHENGVIHRDIKPANILLTPKRDAKIGDFGLARPSGSEGPGLIMGTPGYTAPEVITRPEHADRRSDIYAVGVILYELLTGQLQQPNCPPPSSVGGCDRALDTIWQKATHPNPAFRYPDATQMAKDLGDWLDKSPANAKRKLVPAAGQARALASVGKPSPASTSVPRPLPAPAAGGGSLLRNLLIISALVVAIAFTWKHYQQTKVDRAEAQRIADQQAAATKAKAQAAAEAARLAAANQRALPKNSGPAIEETVMESLERLRDDLAAGKRDEMPAGTIRHGDSDFLLVPLAMSWQEAAAFADDHGGHLPLARSEEDLSWLAGRASSGTSLWLGAGRAGRANWTQADGSPWKLKTPAGTGSYLAVDDLALVRVRKTEDRFPFLIQWQRDGTNPASLAQVLKNTRASLDQPNPLFPPGTLAYEDRHILVVLHESDAAEAADLAAAAGGHLMVPSLRDEAEWLAEQITAVPAPDGLWLGAEREGAEWKWSTGEAWSFALWDKGYPKREGDALTIHPDQGWRDAEPSQTASGFVIEWSKDRESNPATTPQAGRQGAIIASDDLAAKSKQLLASLDKERKSDLAANAKNFTSDLESWLRRVNESENRRWRIEVANLKLLIKDDRIPNGIDDDDDVKLSEEMADSCETYLAKQKAIDATFVAGAERIRKAYLVRLKEAHADAKLRGQSELADSITEQAEAAAELDDWLSEMGIEDGTVADEDDEDEEDDRRSGFSGKWLWNKSPYVIWEVSPAGTLFCRAWGNLQGNWTEDDGEIHVTWRSGGTATLEKRGARWVGTNAKGDKIQLSRAD